MSANRFDAAATLQVVPDTADKTFAFYIWQVVTFTATLTVPGGIADGQTVIFQNVGAGGQEFVLYGLPDQDTTESPVDLAWQVVARSQGADRSVASATIRALYSSTSRGAGAPGTFKTIVSGTVLQSSNPYTVDAPNVSIVQSLDPYQLLPASGGQETPLSSGGNYFVCNAFVSDPKTVSGLKNICLRLSAQANHSFAGVTFYPALNSAATDALIVQSDDSDHWVDVLTDADGVAEIYVCAAKTSGTYAGVIHGKCGITEVITSTFVIPDFKSGANPKLGAPLLPSSELQVPATGTDTIACTIPAYASNAIGDWLFVLCNRRAQRGATSNFPRKVTGQVPALFSKFGLRNRTFGDDDFNELTYIVLPASEPANLASTLEFYAQGDPGTPAVRLQDGKVKAPAIVEMLGHGVVINTKTIANGLTIRVPVGNANTDILWDGIRYAVSVTVDVLGWMADFDDPIVVSIKSPRDREINQADIARGYLDIWFPRIEFWGFGQSVEGAMGRCDVQYTITPIIPGRSVSSKILHCHIDTLPPSGLGSYFD